MDRKIIIDYEKIQTRVAVLEDGELAELYIEDSQNQRTVGNIYRGRVLNILPGMQAAFVDIGLEKNAFLYIDDVDNAENRPIEEVLREGQEITVQVDKEAIGSKGARVTTNITLPGKYAVLIPMANYIGVSKRIVGEEERKRLKSLAQEIRPEDMGLILRTAASDKGAEAFKREVDILMGLWKELKVQEVKGQVPRPLHRDESLVYRTFRDLFTQDVEKFVVNDLDQYHRVLSWVDKIGPSSKNRVEYFDPSREIFVQFRIEDKIEAAIQRKVWLKSGGYLIIEPTEALTVIDVNTGKYVGRIDLEDTVLKTNLEAAEQIAAQIRLRDIGGIIVIDFIDMETDKHRQAVLKAFKQALKRDRTKTNVLGFTGLGLVEMTRKKARVRLSASLLKPCPHCGGIGRIYCPNNM
ncbi:MAG TPA: Rne/Rng family ribonuclease [Bacillota bacterium]|nr:Rne/Rng family ribonuclease [Bacillota bacterium]